MKDLNIGNINTGKSKMKTANQQSGGKKGRADGLKFEDQVGEGLNTNGKIPGVLMEDPESAKEKADWSGKPTTVKSDKNITKGGKIVTGISIKNSPGSTQMQIISFEALIFELDRALPIPPDAKRALELFTGNSTSGETFGQMLAMENILIASLCPPCEVRRKRLLWTSLPAAYSSSLLAYLSNPAAKRRLLNVIYREGTASGGFADWQCWCDTKVKGKNNPNALVVFNLKDFIDLLMGEQWTVRPSEAVLALGPLTFQMKGSGKGKAYHNPQFNMSLNAVRKHSFVKGKLTLFEGDAATVFSKAKII